MLVWLLFVKPAKNSESGDFVIKKFANHSQECPKLESSSIINNKKARHISSNYMEKIVMCKKNKIKDRKAAALKEVGLAVPIQQQ